MANSISFRLVRPFRFRLKYVEICWRALTKSLYARHLMDVRWLSLSGVSDNRAQVSIQLTLFPLVVLDQVCCSIVLKFDSLIVLILLQVFFLLLLLLNGLFHKFFILGDLLFPLVIVLLSEFREDEDLKCAWRSLSPVFVIVCACISS